MKRLWATCAAVGFLLPPLSARADSKLDLDYAVSFWGVPVGHTDYHGTFTGDAYAAKGHFETGGVIGIFFKSVVDATANGAVAAQGVTPTLYQSNSQNRSRPWQQVKIAFQGGAPAVTANPPYDTKKYPVSEAEKKGAIDPLSALTSIFAGLKVDERHVCGTGEQVFDGRRRYDVTFTYIKDEKVTLGGGLFDGTAHLCQIRYTAIAGYPRKDVMAWQTSPEMFADVIAVPAAGKPYLVAVKLWSVRALGTLTITLDKALVDGAAPAGLAPKPG